MKPIPEALEEHLQGDVTTLCRCWRLRRRDGVVLGFTDHDRSLSFDGVEYEASSGFASGALEENHGLAADAQEIAGALGSDSITPEDLRTGLYDSAQVDLFLVNWSDVEQRMIDRSFLLGEVVEEEGGFRAELHSRSAEFERVHGRLFTRACDADLGDERCGVDLADSRWRGSGAIASLRGERAFSVSGFGDFSSGWFRGGRLTFDSGANQGRSMEVAVHVVEQGGVTVELWRSMPSEVAEGDRITIVAGCDKSFASCRVKFGNSVRFRGFPHMPGNDFSFSYPNEKEDMDGGPLIP